MDNKYLVRNEKMREFKAKGLSYASLSKIFGVSSQRVHQIVKKYQSDSNRHLKLLIKKRDNYKCQWAERCLGLKASPDELVVHHIDFNNRNNNFENLLTLCRKCHLYFHRFNHINDEVQEKLKRKKILRRGVSSEEVWSVRRKFNNSSRDKDYNGYKK